jgi:4-hydroxythreonine-4-phosphate dehydrogenase
MGDPLGIGPEIIIKALQDPAVKNLTEYVIIGSEESFKKIPSAQNVFKNSRVAFEFLKTPKKISRTQAGELSFLALQRATKLIKSKKADALVTAPICKEHIQLAGFRFPGHTEYLCHEFGVKTYAMMLFHSRLRVVLTTIHVPLKKIFPLITRANVVQKLELTALSLRETFQIKTPRIAVCGLNPHAGEAGLLGKEEIEILQPALRDAAKKKALRGAKLFGPIAADSVFHQALNGVYDAVLCHYHDQGLIALKSTGFDEGVNMTLGLPFTRTSPDHGTAFDIAGRNLANPKSFICALTAAAKSIA